ncbi:MAG: proteasome accessory factor PafA2 family protein [bacterium]
MKVLKNEVMNVLAGIETEYKITGKYNLPDLCKMAREAVKSVKINNTIEWSYKYPIELYTFEHVDNRMLKNGSRLYNEMHTIEYSSAECINPLDLVAIDKSGESLLTELSYYLKGQLKEVDIIKNNYGYHQGIFGHSNGCHENYCISPKLFNQIISKKQNKIQNAWVIFLITRIIFSGAGKIGPIIPYEKIYNINVEINRLKHSMEDVYYYDILEAFINCNTYNESVILGDNYKWYFDISQRAPFFAKLLDIDTEKNRPLINTRNEPHADPKYFRRLHVILGDSNRSEFSTYIKIALSQLALTMLEEGVLLTDITLLNPIMALRQISADPELKVKVETSRGKLSALEIQSIILNNAIKYFYLSNNEIIKNSLNYWQDFFTKLNTNKFTLYGYLDWITKYYHFLNDRESSSNWKDMQWIDIAYHRLGEKDLYQLLVKKGVCKRLINENMVCYFTGNPPNTRAKERMEIINKSSENINQVNWNYILFKNKQEIYLNNPIKNY